MICVNDFHILRPAFEISQKEALEWLLQAHTAAEKKATGQLPPLSLKNLLHKIGLGEGKIKKRGVSCSDVLHQDWENMEIYNLTHSPKGYHFKERTRLFDQIVTQLFNTFYCHTPLPSHLIHVTCTGYTAPSGAQKLVALKNSAHTTVTHAYHMGCLAAMPALRMGQGFISSQTSVDIVHTELCSLHLNPVAHDIEQLVVQTLFGDGYIKYSLSHTEQGLAILALHEEIIPNSEHCIGWECEDWGLAMKLSKEVPKVIAKALPSFLKTLLQKADLPETIFTTSFFAIHPGGLKIIEEVSAILSLAPWQIAHSQHVLQNYGNMSSATQPHIWEKMWSDPLVQDRSYIISFAFGPGLTISGGIFQKCCG